MLDYFELPLVSFKLSKKPANKKHIFGYGGIEYICAEKEIESSFNII